jgi:hypothetical protein
MRHLMLASMLAAAALLGAGCAAAGWETTPVAYGADVDVGLFYDALSPYGEWLIVEPWGWVWSPRDMPSGWRPYTWGQWVATDLGWTWISYWPWGWAPFHYGRWTHEPGPGWVWVPGSVWAPAWVAWRWGTGWVGWAPLPPEAHWHLGIGLEVDGLELRLSRRVDAWSFVSWHHFVDPGLRHHIEPSAGNYAVLPLTRDLTRYQPAGAWPAERGLALDEVERELGRAVPRYRLEDLSAPPDRLARRPRGEMVGVYRPRVAAAPEGRTPPRTRPPRPTRGGGG